MTGQHKARKPPGSAAIRPARAAALTLGLLMGVVAAPVPGARAGQEPESGPAAAGGGYGGYMVRMPAPAPLSPAPLLSFEQRDARGRLILRVTLGRPAPAAGAWPQRGDRPGALVPLPSLAPLPPGTLPPARPAGLRRGQ